MTLLLMDLMLPTSKAFSILERCIFHLFFSSGLTMFLIFAAGEDIYNGRLFFFILGGRYGCLFCETKEASFGAGL